MKKLALVPVLLVLLTGVAVAGEKDAETRFHEAYVQEVIDGAIAPAAKVYFALMEDAKTPPRIRAESRLRFAVCTVLLGRADEARAQLAALIADPGTPTEVRTKAETYQTSIQTTAIGSELDRKLQALVFDLGRVTPLSPKVAVYRDFEILGDRAVPFLRKLLDHRDVKLRQHALRLLCRVDEDGVVEAWDVETPITSSGFCLDFRAYLSRHPDEQRAYEAKLLGLDDAALGVALERLTPKLPFSPEFAAQVVARPKLQANAAWLLHTVVGPEARQKLVDGWLAKGDAKLTRLIRHQLMRSDSYPNTDEERGQLFQWLLSEDEKDRNAAAYHILRKKTEIRETEHKDVFPALTRYAASMRGMWYRSEPRSTAYHYGNLADQQSPEMLLDSLEHVVEKGLLKGENEGYPYPGRSLLTLGLADLLATALEQHDPSRIDLEGYAEVLKRWSEIYPIAYPLDAKKNYKPQYPQQNFLDHLHWVAEQLPTEEGRALARWLASEVERRTAAKAPSRSTGILNALRVEKVADLPRWRAAYEVATSSAIKDALIDRLPYNRSDVDLDMRAAMLEHLPSLLPDLDRGRRAYLEGALWLFSMGVDTEFAADSIEKYLRYLLEHDQATFDHVFPRFPVLSPRRRPSDDRAPFVVEVWPRVLTALWPDLSAERRRLALHEAWSGFGVLTRGARTPPHYPTLETFLRAHLGEPGTPWPTVALHPDAFPLVSWARIAPPEATKHIVPQHVHRKLYSEAELDAIVRELTKEASTITDGVLELVFRRTTPPTRSAILTHLLGLGDSKLRGMVLERGRRRGGRPQLPAEGLEAALVDLLAEKEPDLGQIREVATLLEPQRPTRKLLPATKLLLESEDRADLLAGTKLAGALAVAELRQPLHRIYTTTLDSRVREAARIAIDTIQKLEAARHVAPPH